MYHTQREGADWNEGTKQVKVACCKDMQQLSFLPMQYRNGRRPLPSVCDKNYVYIQVGNY